MSGNLHTPVALSQGKRARMDMKTGLYLKVIRKISAYAAVEIETPVAEPADSMQRYRHANLETKHSPQRCPVKPRSDCIINPLTPELNPLAQRCLTRYFTGDFVHFVNICVKTQQITNYSFSLLIMYGSSYMFRRYIVIFRERS
jgi:hypothetical protein